MPRDVSVSTIMTTDLVSVDESTGIVEAARLMGDAGVGSLPVVDADDRLVGVLADEHIIVEDARLPAPNYVQLFGAYLRMPGWAHKFAEEVKRSVAVRVGDAMSDDPDTVGPDATVEDVATLMIDRGLQRVYVVDDDRRLRGLVARVDIVRAISRAAD